MSGSQTAVRFRMVALALLLALLPVLGLAARGSMAEPITYPTFAAPALQGVWERYDRPVYYGTAARSYIWGNAVTQGLQEPYAQGPNGQHFVQYFDKSRMEINHPGGNTSDPFYVTQGLLASDMINGRIQLGDTEFQQSTPAGIPFGDLDDTQASSPTYASFRNVLNAPPIPSGQSIVAMIDRAGTVTTNANPQGVTSAGVLDGVPTNHSIASVFLAFLLSRGPVYVGGQDVTQAIFDPLFYVTGYPVAEAYWATVKAAGVNKTVLIQCFERRCLTYTPTNEPAFQVELANTGLQYYNWRYQGAGPSPSPSPSPSQAPTIANLTVTNISSAAATVTWTTDVPATSQVNYGTMASYGQTASDSNLVTSHTVNLAGLAANTLYHYQVVSVNPVSGARTVSADQTFTTANAP
jgi:Purple acid Phosphatase, N-terminal domain